MKTAVVSIIAVERFWSKVNKTNTCWLWVGAKTSEGYGSFRYNNRSTSAHRISYELAKGSIPKELQVDHLCRNRACVNPKHLESVKQRENIVRGLVVSCKISKLPAGVSKCFNKYRSRKYINGNKLHIGSFSTAEDASIAYQTAVICD